MWFNHSMYFFKENKQFAARPCDSDRCNIGALEKNIQIVNFQAIEIISLKLVKP